jgi:hypothetical protein
VRISVSRFTPLEAVMESLMNSAGVGWLGLIAEEQHKRGYDHHCLNGAMRSSGGKVAHAAALQSGDTRPDLRQARCEQRGLTLVAADVPFPP